MYSSCRVKLGISSTEFYSLALTEIYDLLSEKDIYDKEMALLQASNNAMLIMNDKADKVFDDIKKDIYKNPFKINQNSSKIKENDFKRYFYISKRLGLKMPLELEKKYSNKE